MKKIHCACIILLAITFCSCSRKVSAPKKLPEREIQQFIFECLVQDKVSGPFKRIMLRNFCDGKKTVYFFERLYPACTGLYDCAQIYVPECDNGSWVEELLFSVEELRYGQDVLGILEDEENLMSPIIEDNTENAQAEAVEKLLLDAYGRLSILEFGKERFIPQTQGNTNVLIHFSDSRAVRYFYDDSLRLTKKEYWKMVSVEDSALTSTEYYEYPEQSRFPSKKIIEGEGIRLVSNLNENGLVIRADKYLLDEEKKNNRLCLNTTEYSYDEKDRLVLCRSIDYHYDNSKKLINKSEKKEIFYYNKTDKLEEENKMPPDYEYYEDGFLKTRTRYEAKGRYETLVVFESGSVISYYDDYIKTRSEYITNGADRRVKEYEQQ